jgi:transcription elongation factor S-II
MSGCEEDVIRIKKKLDKMMKTSQIDANISIDMLNALKKLPIDLTILKNTGIGVILNNLRKSCDSEELGTVAKSLLKNWKKLVANESSNQVLSPNSNNNDSNPPMSPPIVNGTNNSLNNSKESNGNGNGKRTLSGSSPDNNGITKLQKVESEKKCEPKNENGKPKAKYNPLVRHISFTTTKDPIRLKCREMLANALELTESIENGSELCCVNEIANRCEDVIFNEFKDTGMKYKNRLRSRVINLKDSKNPKLRENVRLGLITPDKLAVMIAEEMASDDLKNLRAKFTKEGIDDHQMAVTQGAKTTLLTCRKCKGKNCSYSEMQTRSADEPMTTFAYCLDCGNRWKFG